MKTVNERTGIELTVSFFDREETPAIPVTAHWRLDCVTTGKVLQDWTEFAPIVNYDDLGNLSSVNAEVEVDAALNVIQKDQNKREVKELTVSAALDTPREYAASVQYTVLNRRR